MIYISLCAYWKCNNVCLFTETIQLSEETREDCRLAMDAFQKRFVPSSKHANATRRSFVSGKGITSGEQ